jgi:hypothetical protein
MGSNNFVRLAGIAWSLVSGTSVVVARRRWILDSTELGFDFEFPVALVVRGDVSRSCVADYFSSLEYIGLVGLPPSN